MNELHKSLWETVERMKQEQKTALANQETRLSKLEKEVAGCQNLQTELERLLRSLESLVLHYTKE